MPKATMTKKAYKKRHPEDEWFDEIRIESPSGPLLRLSIVERWKESHLSGDEWRFSYVWYVYRNGDWDRVPGTGTSKLRWALIELYPLVCQHLMEHATDPVTIHVYRKGVLAWNLPETRPLLVAAGFLPSDHDKTGLDHDVVGVEEATKHLCAQPGCQNEATIEYLIKQEYDHCGNKKESFNPQKRCFCERHKRRGDCALEDADINYERL